MNILFLISSDSPLVKGGPKFGSAMQILLLKKNLENMGHFVFISGSANVDLRFFNVAHITMIGFQETLNLWRRCRSANLPVVVKTLNSWSSDRQLDEMAAHVAAITVESPDEAMMLLGRYGRSIERKIYRLLPAVDDLITNESIPWSERQWVHVNSRYDNNKNHASVVLACKKLGLPVITSGAIHDKQAYQKCLDLEYGTILSELDKKQLSDIYNKTKVYVCSSEQEICSTSICEAIKCGCNVVSSSTNWGNSNYEAKGFYIYQYGSTLDLMNKISSAYMNAEQENQWWSERRLSEEYLAIFERHKK